MAQIIVTASEVRTKASALSELNQQFKGKASELEAKEGELLTMWEGSARDAFHNAFTRDKGQMDVFANLIEQYVAALTEIAQRYEEAEMRATELATARTY